MRTTMMMAAGLLCLSAAASAASLENFRANSTADIAALCGADPDSTFYAEAKQFCFGYISGAVQFHNAVVRTGAVEPIACPSAEATREQFASYFADWARTTATPAELAEPPVEGMARAAAARWPCRSASN
jgi:hypothetical protein